MGRSVTYYRTGTPLSRYGFSNDYEPVRVLFDDPRPEGRVPADYEADLHVGYPLGLGPGDGRTLLVDVFSAVERPARGRARPALTTSVGSSITRARLRPDPGSDDEKRCNPYYLKADLPDRAPAGALRSARFLLEGEEIYGLDFSSRQRNSPEGGGHGGADAPWGPGGRDTPSGPGGRPRGSSRVGPRGWPPPSLASPARGVRTSCLADHGERRNGDRGQEGRSGSAAVTHGREIGGDGLGLLALSIIRGETLHEVRLLLGLGRQEASEASPAAMASTPWARTRADLPPRAFPRPASSSAPAFESTRASAWTGFFRAPIHERQGDVAAPSRKPARPTGAGSSERIVSTKSACASSVRARLPGGSRRGPGGRALRRGRARRGTRATPTTSPRPGDSRAAGRRLGRCPPRGPQLPVPSTSTRKNFSSLDDTISLGNY